MNENEKKLIRIAILDLYEGVANEGMRCINEIIRDWSKANNLNIYVQEFDVRQNKVVPGTDFDIYISSGGPGSPLASEGSEWEQKYFGWITEMMSWNANILHPHKKHVFFICHSFQLACRYFQLAHVTSRKSSAFGVFPVHLVGEAAAEIIFSGLADPFYAVDSRDYQVIKPDHKKIRLAGARILAIEKDRPHVPLERAIMAIRFNEFMIGTQFHPEADAEGMTRYLVRADKKETVINNHGAAKWQSMIDGLNDPKKIKLTNARVLPNFLDHATESIMVLQ